MRTLPPLIDKDSYSREVEKEVAAFFYNLIYKEIIELLRESTGDVYNTISDLVSAILRGQIQYYDGQFHGKFNSKIGRAIKKLGGHFNKKTGTWGLGTRSLPFELQSAIAVAESRFIRLHQDIESVLNKIDVDDALKSLSFETPYIQSITKIEKDFRKTAKSIGIIPEYDPVVMAKLYSENMKLYIKDWTEKNIIKLRQQVQENLNEGFRAENLAKKIERNYGTSQSKAKFLARQETSLLVSNFREQRYKSLGINKYMWSATKDNRTRPLHRELNGKIFTWDNPPVIDERTGQRGHPGMTFGCRCTAIPLLD